MKRTKYESVYDVETSLDSEDERPTKCLKLVHNPLELNLNGSTLTRHSLTYYSDLLGSVVSLTLSCCNYLTDDFLALLLALDSYPNLLCLDLSYTQITDTGIISIATKCPNLSSIVLNGCLGITDVSLSFLAQHCKRIQVLSVSGCPRIGDIGVQLIAQESKLHLHVLDVNDCPRISDKTLLYLGHYCPGITCLRLKNTSVSAPVLYKLLSSRLHLTELNVQGLSLTDTFLVVLSRFQLSSLKLLDISFCTHLSFSCLEQVLEKLVLLEEVHMFGLPTTDTELEAIRHSNPSISIFC